MKVLAAAMIALPILLSTFADPQQPAGGSLEGVVVDAGTDKPIPQVQVTISRVNGGTTASTSAPAGIPRVATDREGRFAFMNLEAGSYSLSFAKNGYARQEFGRRTFTGPGVPIPILSGQQVRGLMTRLTPTGAVSGRIRSRDGNPLPGVPVHLLQRQFNSAGQSSLVLAVSARTNDRGDYRIYFVTPGRYYLVAGAAAEAQQSRPVGNYDDRNVVGSPNENVEKWAYTYYPGVADSAGAALLDVKSGSELSEMNFVLAPRQFYRISGRVVDSGGGPIPPAVTVSLAFLNPLGVSTIGGNPAPGGRFDLHDVVPGAYVVSARSLQNRSPLTRAQIEQEVANARSAVGIAGAVVVNVLDSDVSDVVLPISSATLRGRVRIEGDSQATIPDAGRIQIQLQRSSNADIAKTLPSVTISSVKQDGTFELTSLGAGEYKWTVALSGFYVKQARYGQLDILRTPLLFPGQEKDSLDVVLSPKNGSVEGTVLDERLQPVEGGEAVLIPESRDRIDLYRTAISDRNGHFTMTGIAPGDYRIFAWEAIEPFAYFDSEFITRVEGGGSRVRIAESSRQNVAVRMMAVGGSK